MRKIDEGENECIEGAQREEREQGTKDTTAGGGGRSSSLHRRGTEQKREKEIRSRSRVKRRGRDKGQERDRERTEQKESDRGGKENPQKEMQGLVRNRKDSSRKRALVRIPEKSSFGKDSVRDSMFGKDSF